jgi:hypothetical protein
VEAREGRARVVEMEQWCMIRAAAARGSQRRLQSTDLASRNILHLRRRPKCHGERTDLRAEFERSTAPLKRAIWIIAKEALASVRWGLHTRHEPFPLPFSTPFLAFWRRRS